MSDCKYFSRSMCTFWTCIPQEKDTYLYTCDDDSYWLSCGSVAENYKGGENELELEHDNFESI